jgi:uncharacterized protein YjiS (DUF1127 family)
MAIAQTPAGARPAAPGSPVSGRRRLVSGLAAAWAAWRTRRRFRRDLRRLLQVGPHMVADIGLTPEEAQRESAKPFWRA